MTLAWLFILLVVGALAYAAGYKAGREAREQGRRATPPPAPLRRTSTATGIVLPQANRAPARRPPRDGRGRLIVRPQPRTFWQERGWQARGSRLIGRYQTSVRTFPGRIENYQGRFPRFYIRDVPEQLFDHPHAACFQPRDGDWFFVHFAPRPKDPDSGIRKIEQIMEEVVNQEVYSYE